MFHDSRVILLIPAKNEAESIAEVINDFQALSYQGNKLVDQIVVCDNGSDDATASSARACGAKIVYELRSGYGYACLAAIAAIDEVSDRDIVAFVNGDGSFVAEQLLQLLEPLESEVDLCIGSRKLGGQGEDLVDTTVQGFGANLACRLIEKHWHVNCTDLGPFRVIRYKILKDLHMQDTGTGWKVEMELKALNKGCKVAEVPVDVRVRSMDKPSSTLVGKTKAAYGIFSTIGRFWAP